MNNESTKPLTLAQLKHFLKECKDDGALVVATLGQLRSLVAESSMSADGLFEVRPSLDGVIHLDGGVSEGIDLYPRTDAFGKIRGVGVDFNQSHSKGLATSKEDEPTMVDFDVSDLQLGTDSIQVYSILKRTPMRHLGKSVDCNPLVYAFKGERGYEFKTAYARLQFEEIIKSVLDKFVHIYFDLLHGDAQATVVLPSGNALNSWFACKLEEAAKRLGHDLLLHDRALRKLSVEEFRDRILDEPTSDFNSWLNTLPEAKQEEKMELLDGYLEDMELEHGGLFAFHYVKDRDIRSHITKTMELDEKYGDLVNANILLVDDTMSQGRSLKDACLKLHEAYRPKSMVALTLFSQL